MTREVIQKAKENLQSLAPDETATCLAPYLITQSEIDAGAVRNHVLANGSSSTSASYEHLKTLNQHAQLDVLNTARPLTNNSPTTVGTEDSVVYDLVVTNTGNVTLTDITVTINGLTITCASSNTVTSIAPGGTASCVSSAYLLKQSDIDNGYAVNTVSAQTNFTYFGQGTATSVSDTHPATTYLVSANMTIEKSATTNFGTNNRPDAGETISYTFVVKNTGGVTLSGIEVTDVSIAATDITCDNEQDRFITNLAPGASRTCSASYVVSQANIDSGSLTNTASATSGSVTDSDTITTTLTQSPGLNITNSFKTFTNSVIGNSNQTDAGDTANFEYIISNNGNTSLSNISVSGTSTSAVSCSGSATITSLAPGESATCTAAYTVTQTNISDGSITNTATASTSALTANDSATALVTQSSALRITNTGSLAKGGNNRSDAGETATFTYEITNIGNVPLSNISVTSSLGTVNCGNGATSVATSTPLAPVATNASAKETCTSTYMLTQANINSGIITDTATATKGSASASSDATLLIDQLLDATITNTFSSFDESVVTPNTRVDGGDKATFAYQVTNHGNVTIPLLTVSSSTGSVDCDAGSATSTTVANLAPGQSETCSTTSMISLSQINASTISDTAQASTQFTYYNDNIPTTLTATDVATAPITQVPILEIATTALISPAASPNAPNDVISYTYSVKNEGNTTLTDVEVTVNNQANDSFDNSISSGSINCDGTGTNRVNVLVPGATKTCTTTYSISQTEINRGMVRNHVDAVGSLNTSAADTEETPINQSAQLTISNTARPLVDNSPTGPSTNDTLIYDIVVNNTGNVTLTNITVTLPGLTLTCTPSVPFTLTPGATATCVSSSYTLTSQDISNGTASNIATAETNFSYYNPSTSGTLSESDTAMTYLSPAQITITKSANTNWGANARPDVGDSITYSFSVENTGAVSVSNVDVTDVLIPASSIICLGSGTNTISTIAPGATKTCSATYIVTQANIDSGFVTNTASATSGNTTDSDTITTTLTQQASLEVVKTGSINNAVVAPSNETNSGDTVRYQYTLTNSGNITLTNLVVLDDKISDDSQILCPEVTGSGNTIASLAPGATITCGITYLVTSSDVASGSVTNVVSVAAKKPDGSFITPATDSLTLTLSKPAVVRPPVTTIEGVNDSVTAPMGAVVEVDVLKNDIGKNLSIVSASVPNDGTTQVMNGIIVVTPSLMYTGDLSFNYVLTDGESVATASVKVRLVENTIMPIPEIFLDVNGNGRRDEKEPGIKGVNMNLELQNRAIMRMANGEKGAGVIAASVRSTSALRSVAAFTSAPIAKFSCSTANSGLCAGKQLPIGNYRVKADFTPSRFGLTTTADTDGVLDLEAISVLSGNEMSQTQFGVAGLGSLTGRAYIDQDNDKVFDSTVDKALPLSKIEVTWAGIDGVLGTDDDVTMVQMADAFGMYSMRNIPSGAYAVRAQNSSVAMSTTKATTVHNTKTSKVDFLIPFGHRLAETGAATMRDLYRALALIILGLIIHLWSRRRQQTR